MILTKDLFRLSYIKLKVQRKRMWFSIIGVALGMGLVALGASIVFNGKKVALQAATEQLGFLNTVRVTAPPINTSGLHADDVETIKNLTQSSQVSPEVKLRLDIIPIDGTWEEGTPNWYPPQLVLKDSTSDVPVDLIFEISGIESAFLQDKITDSQKLSSEDPIPLVANLPFLAMIAGNTGMPGTAVHLPKKEDYIGKTFSFTLIPGYRGEKPENLATQDVRFEIIAVNNFGEGNFIPLAQAQKLQKWVYDETLKNIPEATLKDFELRPQEGDYESIYVLANSLAGVKEAVTLLESQGYETFSYEDITQGIDRAFRFFNYLLLTAGSVILLMVMFIVMNTIGKMVSDSTKEIGIFKTLGATRNDIRKIFMTQAFLISSIGSVLGIILGYIFAPLAVYLFLSFINRLPDAQTVSEIANAGKTSAQFFGIAWLHFIIIFLSTLVICTLVSFGRAQRAAKLDPIQALKEE